MPVELASHTTPFARAFHVPCQRSAAAMSSKRADCDCAHVSEACARASRRAILGVSMATVTAFSAGREAKAVQGLTAGRIPGATSDPDSPDFDVYTRPLGKSGGHGVGWSEIPQYSFRVPKNWAETPVSIADAGGTEIDIRFRNRDEGELSIVVAPVLRFRDVGYNANVDMEFLGDPDKIIAGFTPELYGSPLVDGDVLETKVYKRADNTYYQWYMKPHRLVTATATGNRVFLLACSANSRQYRKGAAHLHTIADSFFVPPAKNYNAGF